MSTPANHNSVISRANVRLVGQAALVDCGSVTEGNSGRPLAIVPLLDGDRVAGFEVRCGCGATAVVECVYEEPPEAEAPS